MNDNDRVDANSVEEEGNRDFIREIFEVQIEACRIAFKNTGNPVYVWKVIRLFSPIALAAWQGADPSGRRDVALPSWCVNYLIQCANAVESVSNGTDPRSDDSPEITDTQKVDLLPGLFGFARPGWNAFANFDSTFNMKWAERHFEELRSQGMSYAQALAETAEKYGFEDERSLRKRFAKRRGVFRDDESDGGQT